MTFKIHLLAVLILSFAAYIIWQLYDRQACRRTRVYTEYKAVLGSFLSHGRLHSRVVSLHLLF